MKNYHTHTYRCMHASGSDEDYVKAAIKAGYTVLGFSDHTPWKYDSYFKAKMRMPLDEFDDYYKSLFNLKRKYKDQIEIRIGLECEYFPKYIPWLKKIVKEYDLDFLILGHHYYETDEKYQYFGISAKDDDMLEKYVESTIAGLKTGLFSYVAHPDLYMRAREWDELSEKAAHKICSFCKENDIIMEYNLAGLRYSVARNVMEYPHIEFWKIAAQYGNKAIIGVDAHAPQHLEDKTYYNLALKTLKDLEIEVVEDIHYLR